MNITVNKCDSCYKDITPVNFPNVINSRRIVLCTECSVNLTEAHKIEEKQITMDNFYRNMINHLRNGSRQIL